MTFTITQPREGYRCAVCGSADVIGKGKHPRRFGKPKLKHRKQIAIDEISTGKGHRYVTIVIDVESGAVGHVGEGTGVYALKPFWKRLRASGAKIEAVAADTSPAYIEAVIAHLPNATLVFDRFHVIELYHAELTELRRDLHRQPEGTMQKSVLKGIRRLLLKRPENLDPTRNEPERLEEALRLNEPPAIAYYLKEERFYVQSEGIVADALDQLPQPEAFGNTRRIVALGRAPLPGCSRVPGRGVTVPHAHASQPFATPPEPFSRPVRAAILGRLGASQNANTPGETPKYRASLPMCVRLRERLPDRTSEMVESAIPVALATSVWRTSLASMRCWSMSASDSGPIGWASAS